jgi:hypothetical protein
MLKGFVSVVPLAVALALVCAGCSSDGGDTKQEVAAPAEFESGPCPQTPAPVASLANARCGVLVVPENRAKDNGRTI